jgi:His/Glu/Gln/Arg/opine family amino acid ABC transporter permease subunit
MNSIVEQFNRAFIVNNRWTLYFKGLGTTIEVAFFAAILGIVIGTVACLANMAKRRNGKRPVFSWIAYAYIDVIRGTPTVIQLMIMWFVIMKNSTNGVLVASLSFGLNSGAYVAEIIRGGIQAVDQGQMEAGRSLGLSRTQTMMYVVLPQAFKNAFPSLLNEFITLLKETAIVGYVGMSDLTRVANQISTKTYQPFMPLVGAAVIYFVVIKVLTILFNKLERKLRESDNR